MVTAITERGRNISRWVEQAYPDLSPEWIADELNLWRERPADWSYLQVARHGHFGHPHLPWEQS
jgi:S-adenosylmethionine synthetase